MTIQRSVRLAALASLALLVATGCSAPAPQPTPTSTAPPATPTSGAPASTPPAATATAPPSAAATPTSAAPKPTVAATPTGAAPKPTTPPTPAPAGPVARPSAAATQQPSAPEVIAVERTVREYVAANTQGVRNVTVRSVEILPPKTPDRYVARALVDVAADPATPTGWNDGANVRWFEVVRAGTSWRVVQMASSPIGAGDPPGAATLIGEALQRRSTSGRDSRQSG